MTRATQILSRSKRLQKRSQMSSKSMVGSLPAIRGGHINFTTSPVSFIQEDHEKWQREVEPLIGETDLLVYPFGADIAGVEDYAGAKFEYLKEQGFHAFFHVDASVPAWGQLRPEYLREARINVDGISLKNAIDGKSDTLEEFFDPATVVDPARPESISGSS